MQTKDSVNGKRNLRVIGHSEHKNLHLFDMNEIFSLATRHTRTFSLTGLEQVKSGSQFLSESSKFKEKLRAIRVRLSSNVNRLWLLYPNIKVVLIYGRRILIDRKSLFIFI